MRRSVVGLLVSIVALAPAAGRPRIAPASERASIAFGDYQHIQVNVDSLGQNVAGDAANEPTIVVDPTRPNRLVIGWRQFDDVASKARQAGFSYSRDLGRNWSRVGYLDPGQRGSDPVLEADADGRIYYQSLRFDVAPAREYTSLVFRSDDGGRMWDPPAFAYGGDKPWMAIDRTNGPGRNHVYLVWSPFFTDPMGHFFTRSTDRGFSFDLPVTMEARPTIATVAVGPDGTVWIAGNDARPDSPSPQTLTVAWSSNAQDPWATPAFSWTRFDGGGEFVVGDQTTWMPNPGGYHGQIWIDVDRGSGPRAGNVYVLASLNPPGSDPMDVFFMRSTDGGTTWSSPRRVNDDPVGNDAWQWFGTMSVAPNGRIDVVWNDTRNSGQSMWSELFYSWSGDGGLTWSPNEQLSPAWNSHVGWPVEMKIGDYYDMESDDLGVHLAWAATFNGEQDVYYTRIGDTDCNGNGTGDTTDIAEGTSLDLDRNGVPDDCEVPTEVDMCLEIVREDTILGLEGFVQEATVDGQLGSEHFFRPEDGYIRWLAERSANESFFVPMPDGTRLVKSQDIEIGDSWPGFMNEPTNATVIRTESVTIPGRTLDCAVVEHRTQAGDDVQATLWFAEDFGLVRYFNYKEGIRTEMHSSGIVGGSGFYPVAVGNWWCAAEPSTGVAPGSTTSTSLALSAFPNPTTSATIVAFVLPAPELVQLDVYGVRGNHVRALWRGRLERGPHQIGWDGRDSNGEPLAAGVYFLRLVDGSRTVTRKVVVLR